MKFVFFGTPDFAAIILEKLVKTGWPPVAVICNPDRPVGRKKVITPPPTKVIASKYGIKVYQPEKLEIENLKKEIGEIDFAVVVAYAKIIPKNILEMPRLGFIAVHPSLLPKYRGSSPIQSVILNGEKETGVALFLADEKVDHGPILATSHLPIVVSDNYVTLNKKLAELGGDLLIKILPEYLENKITPLPQDESQATFTQKFITQDGYVDLEKDKPEIIERKVRALNPEPGVWTIKDGKRMKILEAELITDNKLKLKKIQFEGKKPVAF
jgi:methionyl-tRNA formyltransferase